ncbi:helix-turn-helix domain-containing protein [Collimonas sp.]|jgi:transcriptional regulator with XRE-family HTH domain|uniref:helix-turn-helix domain-containing protein n=1 Tax=Collimonas sp. TaxID=1963772 RepID=UPI002C20F85A|nr:helix-turn-helix domain-containing protein [Collimonas sp.]HWX01603.1 helix-turn-helix domain-containing protein [Collimonas sp.]
MKLTPYGLCVRKIRLELGLALKDMAASLSVSSAYLSSIELGEKALSCKVGDQALAFLAPKISAEQYDQLQTALAQSMKAVPVSELQADERNLVAIFARRMSDGNGVPEEVLKWLRSGEVNDDAKS